MNRITLTLKRPFIWLSRFRHRCGYGVHSPFAFNLITQVIYESTPYYKYKDHVEPVTGAVKERSITYFIMMQNDFSLLNKIMRKIKKENNDVLSINSGVAFGENVPTIISFKTKMTLADINLLAESIRRIKGIIRIVVSEEEGSR